MTYHKVQCKNIIMKCAACDNNSCCIVLTDEEIDGAICIDEHLIRNKHIGVGMCQEHFEQFKSLHPVYE